MKTRFVELLISLLICAAGGALLAVRAQSPPIFGGKVPQAGQSLSGVIWPRARRLPDLRQ